MWTRNNDVSNWNMLKHFIYLSFSKLTTSFLCSLYYKYSSKLFSFFCIFSFLVKAISIDQTFYSAMHYLAAMWLNSRHDFNNHYQIILTLDRINILTIESEVDLYQWVKDVNKINELCNEYKQAIRENKLKLHSIELKHCKIIDDVLFRKNLLWVSEKMHTELLKKIHDQSFIFHFNNQRTINLV